MKFWLWTARAFAFGCVVFGLYIFNSVPHAHADANSYLAYLADHHVNTAFNPPSKNLSAGFYICDSLHAGQTPDQISASNPVQIVDLRGMIDAAQHELCPDTAR